MTAASSTDERYCTSSMNSPTAVCRSAATSATATRRRGRSCSRLPVSASPEAKIHAELQVAGPHLERSGEVRQHARGPAQARARGPAQIEAVERAPQLRRQQLRQRAAFGRLDPDGGKPLLVGERAEPIQKDGLADPTSTRAVSSPWPVVRPGCGPCRWRRPERRRSRPASSGGWRPAPGTKGLRRRSICGNLTRINGVNGNVVNSRKNC